MRKEYTEKRPKRASSDSATRRRNNAGLELINVKPLTDNQALVFNSDKHLVLDGSAGTGKTFISMFLGLEDVFENKQSGRRRVVIVRSNVETRKMGFQPGNDKEKMAVYEAPYLDIASELFNCGTAYDSLKAKGLVHFMPTSFIRGTTMRDATVIVDECQNMTYHELDSVITRVGQNCRIIFCGDYFQSDLKDTGIRPFQEVLRNMNDFDFINFTTDDIVRSEFVKNYLVTKYKTHGNREIL